jgi:hypothetical protein
LQVPARKAPFPELVLFVLGTHIELATIRCSPATFGVAYRSVAYLHMNDWFVFAQNNAF